jgi:hypothetical protein
MAISGTHGVGKSTLIDAFLAVHPEFIHEPEAYEVLQDDYGEGFAGDPSAEDFQRQLEFNIERIGQYRPDDSVIFERCPLDYLAYLYALDDLGRDRGAASVLKNAFPKAREALGQLDLIVFLPENDLAIELSEEEDIELRSAVDARLESILLADDLGLFSSGHPVIVELRGTTMQRLQKLTKWLAEMKDTL